MLTSPRRSHFSGVGLTALAAALAAVALTIVGARRRDGRTVLVGTAFSAMAALLALHGIATPGILVGMNGVVAFTGGATLPVGAAMLALSALARLRRANERRAVARPADRAARRPFSRSAPSGCSSRALVPSVPATRSTEAYVLLVDRTCPLRPPDAARAANLPAHPPPRRPGRRRRASSGWPRPCHRRCCSATWSSAGGSATASSCSGSCSSAVPVALDLRRAAQSRPLVGDVSGADLVAGEEAFLGSHVRALTRQPRPQGRVHGGAHAPRRPAGRSGRRGARALTGSRLRALATGALVHDIGKLSVPDSILQKPGPLTDEEFAVIKRHPEWGDRMLVDLGFGDDVRHLVRDHHERLDGSGYPHGSESSLISFDARILARVRRLRRADLDARLPRRLDARAGGRIAPRAERHVVRREMRRGARARARQRARPTRSRRLDRRVPSGDSTEEAPMGMGELWNRLTGPRQGPSVSRNSFGMTAPSNRRRSRTSRPSRTTSPSRSAYRGPERTRAATNSGTSHG